MSDLSHDEKPACKICRGGMEPSDGAFNSGEHTALTVCVAKLRADRDEAEERLQAIRDHVAKNGYIPADNVAPPVQSPRVDYSSPSIPDYGSPWERMGASIGRLVATKQKAYGDSFTRSSEVMRTLYGERAPSEDTLTVVRVIDKLFRIATDRDALGESPWKDIAGYALLECVRLEGKTPALCGYSVKAGDYSLSCTLPSGHDGNHHSTDRVKDNAQCKHRGYDGVGQIKACAKPMGHEGAHSSIG